MYKHKKFWRSAILFLISILFLLTMTACSSFYLTESNYKKITNGMSYEQVVEILGGNEGDVSSSAGYGGVNSECYIWTNAFETKNIVVIFVNGKVFSKSQTGL